MIDYKFMNKLYKLPDDFFDGIPKDIHNSYLVTNGQQYEVDAGIKFDSEKPKWNLLPLKEVESVVEVLTFGAKKYKANNWQHVENAQERYFDAMMRHIVDWQSDEKFDPETKKNHLAHAVCNALFLLWFDNNK
jgi:hypothetical protein